MRSGPPIINDIIMQIICSCFIVLTKPKFLFSQEAKKEVGASPSPSLVLALALASKAF